MTTTPHDKPLPRVAPPVETGPRRDWPTSVKVIAGALAGAAAATGLYLGLKPGDSEPTQSSVPAATASQTPGASKSPEVTPSASATPSPTEAAPSASETIAKQLLNPAVTPEQFAAQPHEMQALAAVILAKSVETDFTYATRFTGKFPDGTSLESYNPYLKPLGPNASGKDISRQNMFMNGLMLGVGVHPEVTNKPDELNKVLAAKVAMGGFAYGDKVPEGADALAAITKATEVTQYDDASLANSEVHSYTTPAEKTLPDGSSALMITLRINVGGQDYDEEYAFVKVPELKGIDPNVTVPGLWVRTNLTEIKP